MDNGLKARMMCTVGGGSYDIVVILVLMDNGLKGYGIDDDSRHDKPVVILVLMDNGLKVSTPQNYEGSLASRNPCSNG